MDWRTWWPFSLFFKRNLETPKHETLPWSDDKVDASLEAMYERAEDFAISTAAWYVRKKGWPARISRMSRGAAVVLLIFGMLTPLVGTLNTIVPWVANLVPFGYVALALAGSALLVDRFGSFSTAWMRYIATNLRIQRLLRTFQVQWQIGKVALAAETNAEQKRAKVLALLNDIAAFTDKISQAVEDETAAWVAEFRDTLAQLQRSISERQKSEDGKTKNGSIAVTLTNFDDVKGSDAVHIFMDDAPMLTVKEKSATLPNVSPGSHTISAKAMLNNKMWKASTPANVSPGGAAQVSLTLVE
jgi:hypothetical protein